MCIRDSPEAIDRAIEHMHDRGERMPVVGMDMGERPSDARDCKSLRDHRIRGDISGIVVIEEFEPAGLAENNEDQRRETQAYPDDPRPGQSLWRLSGGSVHGVQILHTGAQNMQPKTKRPSGKNRMASRGGVFRDSY